MTVKLFENIYESVGSVDDIEKMISAEVRKFINNYQLDIDGLMANFSELELYYYNDIHYPDPYVHKNEIQKMYGEFYVHRLSWLRGGIDITFGNEESNSYLGLLLRGLELDGQYISGPGRVKSIIATKLGITTKSYGALQGQIHRLKIQKRRINADDKIFQIVRKGLRCSKKDNSDNPFIFRKYRFIKNLTPNHKFST